MPRRLGVNGDEVAARLGESLQEGIDGFDHQMTIEQLVGMAPQRGDDRRPEGDVGHVMPVHHVEMNPVRAGFVHGAHLFAELGEVGGEDGGGDLDAHLATSSFAAATTASTVMPNSL